MPAKSKQQMKLFGAVAGGAIKLPGLSKEEAREAIRGQEMKNLPRFAKLKDYMKKKHKKG